MTDLEIYRIAQKYDSGGYKDGEMEKLWKQMTDTEKEKFRKDLLSFRGGYHGMKH